VVLPSHFWPATPMTSLGVVRSPQKAKKKKKNGEKCVLGFWGWLRQPPTAGMGVPEATLGPWGWSCHPQNPFFLFFFFFIAFWGWPDHPFGQTTPRPAVGVAPATPWPKWGGPATPFWPRGWLEPPSLFFYFFLI
jgi:hypothetical protein